LRIHLVIFVVRLLEGREIGLYERHSLVWSSYSLNQCKAGWYFCAGSKE
jgi:hypothetical protein